jgi:hypothetical protein
VAVGRGVGLRFGLRRGFGRGVAVAVGVAVARERGASSRPALTGSEEMPIRCVESELAAYVTPAASTTPASAPRIQTASFMAA